MKAATRLCFAAIIFNIFAHGISFAADKFTVTIARKYSGEDCTSGYLAVDGQVIAYTLELPWKNNEPLISSIPAGIYSAHLRYDKGDKWRMQFDNVEGRSGVQIHIGNYTDEIEGCILVGKGISDDLCSLQNSAGAYKALKDAFYGSPEPNMTPDKAIMVEIAQ